MKLSPLNLSGLIANQNREPKDREPQRVTGWICPSCDKFYGDKSDAEECCADDDQGALSATDCPICAAKFQAHHDAASCCLWKDFDMATRHRIADAVQAGRTWMEAIQAESKKH